MERNMLYIVDIDPITFKVANGQSMMAWRQGKLKVISCMICNFVQSRPNINILITINPPIVNRLPYNLMSVKEISEAGFKIMFPSCSATVAKINRPNSFVNFFFYCL